jgi:hypothetical protein
VSLSASRTLPWVAPFAGSGCVLLPIFWNLYWDEIDRKVDSTERVPLRYTEGEPGVVQRCHDFRGHDEVPWPGDFDGACDEIDERPEIVAATRVDGPVTDSSTCWWKIRIGSGHGTNVGSRFDGVPMVLERVLRHGPTSRADTGGLRLDWSGPRASSAPLSRSLVWLSM